MATKTRSPQQNRQIKKAQQASQSRSHEAKSEASRKGAQHRGHYQDEEEESSEYAGTARAHSEKVKNLSISKCPLFA